MTAPQADLLEGNPGLRSQLSAFAGMRLDQMNIEMSLMQVHSPTHVSALPCRVELHAGQGECTERQYSDGAIWARHHMPQTVQYLWAHQMQLFAAIFFFFSFLMPQVKLVLSGLLWFHPSMWDDRCVRV